MTIFDLERRVKAMDIKKVAVDSLTATIDELEATNKKQLFAGFNKDGERLKKYASPSYASYKAGRNPLPGFGNPDLFNTGSFYARFSFSVTGQQIIQGSTDSKAPALEAKYGSRIFGLGGRYKQTYISEDLQPTFNINVKKAIGI